MPCNHISPKVQVLSRICVAPRGARTGARAHAADFSIGLAWALELLLAVGATPALAALPPATNAGFQIVESVPVATSYGQPGLARTPQAWLRLINSAQHRIDIAAFYFSPKAGSSLDKVLDALLARARAGVTVRILIDQTFLKKDPHSIDRFRKAPGITLRVLPVDKLTGGVLHAKYMLIDGQIVFVGSQNWDWRAMEQIHEIGAIVRNARFAQTYAAAFDFDWELAADPDLPRAARRAMKPLDFDPATAVDPVLLTDAEDHTVTAFPAFSPPSMTPHALTAEEPALIQMIRASQHSFRLQVMTLSAIRHYGPKGWWSTIDSALRDAAARGVQVHIIVANWALHEPMQAYLKSLAAMPNITVKFSTLPTAPSGFIRYARVQHAKYAVADDRSIYIGTGNWEWSYFHNTVDASVFVHGAGPAKTVTEIFNRDWNGPYVTMMEPGGSYKEPRTE